MRRLVLLLMVGALLGPPIPFATAGAQEEPVSESPRDSVDLAYLPFVRFDSDIGFEGGLTLNRYHYEETRQPFKTLTELRLRATTRGLFNTRIAWETTALLGTAIRSRFELIAERQLNDIFFPLGNDTVFNAEQWDDGYYFFDSYWVEGTYEGRIPLARANGALVDGLVLAGGLLSGTTGDLANTSIGDARPRGVERGGLGVVGLGLLYDSRDSEFDPRRGLWARLEATAGIGTYATGRLQAELTGYHSWPLLDDLVLAARVGTEWTTGRVPYWRLPVVGGEQSVRGYPMGRFRDRGALVTNVELRQWITSFDWLNLRLGATVFSDAGRVFDAAPSSLNQPFRAHHRTFGGGLLVSAFTPDFVVRLQIGRSDELIRIYMNDGFTF